MHDDNEWLSFVSGELRLGTDESVFNAVLCSRSFPQLMAIFQEYQFLTGHDIDDAIKAEFSGDLEKALRAIGKKITIISLKKYLGKLTSCSDLQS